MRRFAWLALAIVLYGCGRAYYREDADRETYAATHDHMRDPRWQLPNVSIDPEPSSRLFDPNSPDYPPFPPDDPAAYALMMRPGGMKGSKHWHDHGDSPWIEDPGWRRFLELDKDGRLVLTADGAVELGVRNSREYQTQLENLYLTSLRLTLERFEFDLRWFGTNNTFFQHFGAGSVPTESNTLSDSTTLGFNKAFAAGGQLATELANAYVFEYAGPDHYTVSTQFVTQFIQPLLRRAGRQVRLEGLTQSERDVLYAVRSFMRFRRAFSVDLTTQSGFLGLLGELQNIRNQEANLVSREQNLRLNTALNAIGTFSVVQLDQAFQSYQEARSQLIIAQANFEASVDRFLFQLGLPPTYQVKLDDSLLDQFQLSDPALVRLQEGLEKLQAEFRAPEEAPSLEQLRKGFERLYAYNVELTKYFDQVDHELQQWAEMPREKDADQEARFRAERSRNLLHRELDATRAKNVELDRAIPQAASGAIEATRKEDWARLKRLLSQQIEMVSQLFVIQNQVRVHLIRLQPVDLSEDEAIAYALAERLDLMNRRAQVVDAWRKIAVAANALKGDLNVVVDADIGSRSEATRPFDFNALNSRYRVGLQFDGPLNRQAERNAYRASLINYQQSRRAFMELEDQIKLSIRQDLRQLNASRLNFEIARQSLAAAARQVEAARSSLTLDPRNTPATATLDAINALNTLLAAKSALISSWVNYQTLRAQLLRDLEALPLDDRGIYRDDQPINLEFLRSLQQSTCP